MQIQSHLGSTIAMAFDECVENPAPYEYAKQSCARTVRWLKRCKAEMERLNSLPETINPHQMLFGINQGCTFEDLRVEHMKEIAELDLDGYAIGGLAVGEPKEEMYRIISAVTPHMPENKPRYLMGVGTPGNILEAVSRGVDLFDCVMPSRNARHGHLNTWDGIINIKNAKYEADDQPIDPKCDCPTCRRHSRAYLRHLFKAGELLALRLAVMHNLYFYNTLMEKIREALAKAALKPSKTNTSTVWIAASNRFQKIKDLHHVQVLFFIKSARFRDWSEHIDPNAPPAGVPDVQTSFPPFDAAWSVSFGQWH